MWIQPWYSDSLKIVEHLNQSECRNVSGIVSTHHLLLLTETSHGCKLTAEMEENKKYSKEDEQRRRWDYRELGAVTQPKKNNKSSSVNLLQKYTTKPSQMKDRTLSVTAVRAEQRLQTATHAIVKARTAATPRKPNIRETETPSNHD